MNRHRNEQLSLAIQYAVEVHKNQFDREGKPYILHPLHIMNQFLWDTELAIIAVLHDVVEDGGDMEYIRETFSTRVCEAIALLTHLEDECYESYIGDICLSLDAIQVKLKDLEHNSDLRHLKGVSKKDFLRGEKYHKAYTKLRGAELRFTNHA